MKNRNNVCFYGQMLNREVFIAGRVNVFWLNKITLYTARLGLWLAEVKLDPFFPNPITLF